MKYQVIVPTDVTPFPEKHEMTAAVLLADYFKCDVTFIKRMNGKSADVLIGRHAWEIKSPTGNGKHTIQHKLQEASKQSPCVVLDCRRSKMHQVKLNNEIRHQFAIIKRTDRVIIIQKNRTIIDLNR